jgi:hypothetical protein
MKLVSAEAFAEKWILKHGFFSGSWTRKFKIEWGFVYKKK